MRELDDITGVTADASINFGAPTLREGLRRIVNDFPSAASRLRVNQVVVDRAIRQRY